MLTTASPLLDLSPACSRCIENDGLCFGCATFDRAILPQIATPPWVKLIVSKRPNPAPHSVAQVAQAAHIPHLGTPGRGGIRRLLRALNGERTRTTKAREEAA